MAGADYAEIAHTLAAWRDSGVLIQDEIPGYYVMRQRFTAPSGELLTRIGFYAELGLAEYAERRVLPHERTLAVRRRTGSSCCARPSEPLRRLSALR